MAEKIKKSANFFIFLATYSLKVADFFEKSASFFIFSDAFGNFPATFLFFSATFLFFPATFAFKLAHSIKKSANLKIKLADFYSNLFKLKSNRTKRSVVLPSRAENQIGHVFHQRDDETVLRKSVFFAADADDVSFADRYVFKRKVSEIIRFHDARRG